MADESAVFSLGTDDDGFGVFNGEDSFNDCQEFLILCLHASGGNRVGASFYDAQDAILHLVQDVNDDQELTFTRSLIDGLRPAHLIICANQAKNFLEMIKKYDPDDTGQQGKTGPEVHRLFSKEFALSACTERVMRQKLPSETYGGGEDNNGKHIVQILSWC